MKVANEPLGRGSRTPSRGAVGDERLLTKIRETEVGTLLPSNTDLAAEFELTVTVLNGCLRRAVQHGLLTAEGEGKNTRHRVVAHEVPRVAPTNTDTMALGSVQRGPAVLGGYVYTTDPSTGMVRHFLVFRQGNRVLVVRVVPTDDSREDWIVAGKCVRVTGMGVSFAAAAQRGQVDALRAAAEAQRTILDVRRPVAGEQVELLAEPQAVRVRLRLLGPVEAGWLVEWHGVHLVITATPEGQPPSVRVYLAGEDDSPVGDGVAVDPREVAGGALDVVAKDVRAGYFDAIETVIAAIESRLVALVAGR